MKWRSRALFSLGAIRRFASILSPAYQASNSMKHGAAVSPHRQCRDRVKRSLYLRRRPDREQANCRTKRGASRTSPMPLLCAALFVQADRTKRSRAHARSGNTAQTGSVNCRPGGRRAKRNLPSRPALRRRASATLRWAASRRVSFARPRPRSVPDRSCVGDAAGRVTVADRSHGSSLSNSSSVTGQTSGIGSGGWPSIVSGVARNAWLYSLARLIRWRIEGVNASAASSRNRRTSARQWGTSRDNGHASAFSTCD